MSNRTGSDWNPTTFQQLLSDSSNGGTPPTVRARILEWYYSVVTGADFTDFGIGEFRRSIVSARAIQHTATNVVREGELLAQ